MARGFSSTKYINVTDNADQRGMATATWCCWVRPTGTVPGSGGYCWGKPYTTTTGTWSVAITSTGRLFARCTTTIGGTVNVQSSEGDVPNDEWHHITGRYNGTDCRIFLDGLSKANNTTADGDIENDADSQKDLFIGALTGSESTRYMPGDICECAMWDRDLSDEEIRMVYRHGVLAVLGSLVVYIPVNGNPPTEREFINDRGTLTHTGSPAKVDHAPIPIIGSRTRTPRFGGFPPSVGPSLEDFTNLSDLDTRSNIPANSQTLAIPENSPAGLLTNVNRRMFETSLSLGVSAPMPVTIIYREVPETSGVSSRFFSGVADIFGNDWGITTFTCESRVSLSVPANTKLEVHQIIFANPTATDGQIAYGGS